MARKIAYALEELLSAAGVPHRVERTDKTEGWDLFYGAEPPRDEALWMAASRAAWRYFERPGIRVGRVDTQRVGEEWVRLPGYALAGESRSADFPVGGFAGRKAGATAPPLPDLAAAAFFFLSRWEEWQAPERDGFGRFPLAASVFGRGLWSLTECPVETYARALGRAVSGVQAYRRTGVQENSVVRSPYPARSRTNSPLSDTEYETRTTPERPAFTVGLSHDIDTVRRWDGRGFARAGWEAMRAVLHGQVRSAARAAGELWSGLRVRLGDRDPHQNLEEITRLESAAGAKSSFFLIVRHAHRWDGTHSAHYQRLLPSLARSLAAAAEVGVHAGTAAVDAASLQEERKRLEALIGGPVRGVRYHILRRGYEALPDIAAAGFEYDSTLGFAEEPGFRAGIARPFRAYDRERDRPLDLIEVPLAVMDTTLLSSRYLGLEVAAGRQRARLALAALRRWGGAAALLWHNDNLPPNTAGGYAALYTELIEWTRAAGGRVAPLAEIVKDWKQTRTALQGEGITDE